MGKKENFELKHSDELYKGLFESNTLIVLIINSENGNILNANQSACSFYGYSKKKLMSMNISEINTLVEEELKILIQDAINLKNHVFNFIHKLSSEEQRRVRVTTTKIDYFNTPALFSIIKDITKEFQIKNRLIHIEEEFKNFFKLSINLHVITNKDGDTIEINDACKNMFGYDRKELINRSFIKLLHSDDIDNTKKELKKVSIGENVHYFENRCIHKDGSDVYLAWTATTNSTKDLIFASAQNITKRKIIELEKEKKEKLLVQQSKMAMMGEMIANIAHQWKQPLSLISMSNGLLKLNQENAIFSSDEEKAEAIKNIDSSVKNLSDTIDDFKNFFRPDKEKNIFQLVNIYKKIQNLMKSQFKNYNVELVSKLEEIDIYGYENQLLQVLINIIKNARDELVRRKVSDRKIIFVNSYQIDKQIIIEIKDTAGGIPDNIINQIFEPYFTTKNDDKGTGIGLYICKQIIEGMNGKIEASNITYNFEGTEYKGAKFIIKLPLL